MATVVEKTHEGTIYRCPKSRKVPDVDILTLLFDTPYSDAKDSTPLHVSAAYPSHSINKSQLRLLVQQTAYLFRHTYGIGANGPNKDVVSLICSGNYQVPTLFYAVWAAGGVSSASNVASTPSELARPLKLGNSKLLICTSDTEYIAEQAAAQVGLSKDRILQIPDEDVGEWRLTRLSDGKDVVANSSGLLSWPKITDPRALEDSLAVLIYSSGTTGLPKAVQLSHRNLVAAAVLTFDPTKEYHRKKRPNFEFRTVAHLPIAHIAGIQGYLINPFYMGGPVYWMPRFDFPKFLTYNRKYRITYLFSVPPIFLLIAKSSEVTDQFDYLEHTVSGAAPLGRDLQIAASRKLGGKVPGGAFIIQTWGLSEATGSVTLATRGWRDESGSVSMLIEEHEARIIDDSGKDVEPGQPGEIIVRGPVMTKGYFNDAAANAESFRPGRWFCTGDVGLFRDGVFYVVDRKKELIKYKGLQVAPAELEALLLSHPDILDAAVIGVEAEGTEVPRAYVVANKSKIGAEAIMRFVAKEKADYKRLRGGVVYLDAIPKSPSGKILRRDLREVAKKDVKARL
ncbi:MAG: hypothetical protein M1820_010159 [Bogoriella megaspora]|nr:MAG: hypothetical protein M1820_010159 [Bogoriella megaspora]